MIKEPLFSVLIANYNNGCFLQFAIDSVLAQTYSNWEVVIVDDKSTDDSFDIYEKYRSDPRFHIYLNERNMGCGYTKRRCADLAKGEICGFLDPDDALLPNALQDHVKVHQDFPKVSIVYSRAYKCDSEYNINGECALPDFKSGETYFDYRWMGSMHLASYKNECYKKTIGINAKALAGVDQDLYFKIEEMGEIYPLNKFTYKYVVCGHPNAVSSGIGKNGTLWYWNLVVRRDACVRRGLDPDVVLSNDMKYLLDNAAAEGAYLKELEIRSSLAYRIGKTLLFPFSWIKKKKHNRGSFE